MRIPEHYMNIYVTEEDIQKIAWWGVDSIRLPFNYRLLTPAFDVNMVCSFHKYWNEHDPAGIQNYLNV